MTQLKKVTTKESIMETATQLFAQNGYSGTSIRDIASSANVNVAAVNYHFGNKKNLYWEAFYKTILWAEKGADEIAQETEDLGQAVVRFFEYLMDSPETIRTSLQINFSQNVPPPEGELAERWDKIKGPPGELFFANLIKKQFGEDVTDEVVYFAVQCLYGHMMFMTIVCTSPRYPQVKDMEPHLKFDGIKENLLQHSKVIIDYIKDSMS